MRVDIYDSNFQKIDLEALDIITDNFRVSSPAPKHERTEMKYGRVTLGTSLEGRSMTVSFHIHGRDKYDFVLLRDELYNYLSGLDFLYIIDRLNPAKRWKVKVESSYEAVAVATVLAVFDIEFTSDSPYCESLGMTTDPLTFDSEMWQFGQGLLSDDDINYTKTDDKFRIYNAGNTEIDPRNIHTPLTIEITAGVTSSNATLTLTNTTTGVTWTYTGAVTTGQIIQLKNVQALLNGASIFTKTNYKIITLKRGYNEFTKSTNISQVKFISRFYYL
jgi:hypothetical protein